jgi:RNA polymerase sigma-70 factor (ECF subfamily)
MRTNDQDDAQPDLCAERRQRFAELANVTRSDLLRVCALRLGDRDAAEDAVQETLLAAFMAFERFDDVNPRGWLIRIALNKCTDELRRRRKKELRRSETPLEALTFECSVEQLASAAEQWRAFRLAMARLSPQQRRVMTLVFLCDLSYAEAAALTNSPPGTVRSRLHRARAAIREAMDRRTYSGND